MTTTQHTPGPWNYFVGNANGRGLIRIETSHDACPAAGVHIASLVRNAQSEANARLMYLAPDMLGIHRDSVEILGVLIESREQLIGEEDEVARDLLDRIKEVIALATGAAS